MSATQAASNRISELKIERDNAYKRLRELDKELKRASPSSQQLTTSEDLSSLGYIRQFSGEAYDESKAMGVPGGALEMGSENFIREGRALLASLGLESYLPRLLRGPVGASVEESPDVKSHEELIGRLTLSNDKIWDREKQRDEVKSPWVIKIPYYVLCFVLDVLFDKRPISRFWLLETVARMPYFSYISLLHFYETLGWWRRSLVARKIHFAEEWNEVSRALKSG